MGFFGGTEKVDVLLPQQMGLVGDLASQVRGQIGQGVDSYGGQIAPDATGNQLAAFGQAGQLGQRQDDSATISRLLSGRGDMAGVQQYYNDSVLAPAQQQFDNALGQIDERYGNTWGATGAHQEMVGDAASNFATGIGSVLGNLVYQDRNAAADRQLQGVQANAMQGQDIFSRLGGMAQLGEQERSIYGQQNSEQYNKWLSEQDYANPWLGAAQTALSPAFAIGNDPGMASGIASLVHPL